MADANKPIPCGCGQEAVRVFNYRGPRLDEGVHAEQRRLEAARAKERGMAWHEVTCAACGWDDFDEFPLPLPNPPPLVCGKCGGVTRYVLTPGIDRHGERDYPYFDRGLGCMMHSKEHRRQVMKERGVVCIEGAMGSMLDDMIATRAREDEEAIAADNLWKERSEHDPKFADYRRARDIRAAKARDNATT